MSPEGGDPTALQACRGPVKLAPAYVEVWTPKARPKHYREFEFIFGGRREKIE